MGVRILGNRTTALYCSTTDWAFGPVIYEDSQHDAEERAEAFLRWLGPRDPRRFTDTELQNAYSQWLAQEAEQWKAEGPYVRPVR